MAINKLITSEGNVQFIFGDTDKIINVHPFHIYTTFNEDTVSFILIGLPKSSGLAIFTSKAEDLEVNGEIYSFNDLPDALADAFAIAGAQMRYEVVDELPETGQTNTIYLVPKQGGSGFDEYIYVRDTGEWELIGDTDIELARYMKKEDFNAYSAATKLKIDYLSGATDYVSGAVDTEVARATSAETGLQTAIDNEASARTEADATLQTNIDNEASARTSADTALQTAIDNEISARTEADNTLQGNIDTVSGNVETETSRATSAETELQTAIDNEASARTSADTALQTALDNEISARTSADTALQTAIDNEASARTEADSALSDKIDYVSGAVDTEVSARGAADNYISGAVDTLSSVKADKADAVASAVYVSSSTTIDLKNISGEVISQVDASDFIVDGMVEDVRIENGYLIIDFNTASGIEDIEIPLTDIFNPSNYYDKDDIDNIVSGINEDIADEVSARTEAISGLTEKIGEDEETTARALVDLYEKKLDASAYTPTDLSQYWTSAQTQSAITEATSGLQETLTAGTNIDITNNVISVTGISIETSSAVTSGDIRPIQSGALFDELRIPGESESGLTLEWELYDGGATTNYPSGQCSKIIFENIAETGETGGDTWYESDNGFNFNDSEGFDIGHIEISINDGVVTVYNAQNVTYSISGNNVTVEYPSIAANVDHIYASYDNYWTTTAYISTTTMIPLIDQVSANTVSLSGKADTSALSGYVTTNTDQDISGIKTFVGEKKIKFKQSSDSNKLGFTLYSSASTNNELGAFELRPNTVTVDGVQHPLIYIGHYRTDSSSSSSIPQTMVGFRQYDQYGSAAYHYLIPLPEKAKTPFSLTTSFKNYYAPIGFKNGSTMITADETGVADLSSELGGLKLVKLTQQEYDALTNKDANTLYIISD